MATIKSFGNLNVQVRVDHNPPHAHIVGPDLDISFELNTFKTIAGYPSRRRLTPQVREILDWAKENQALLMETWNSQNPPRIK